MRYLIDGHNLIAQLPDLDLEDPHDEAKLVYKLRSFAARTGNKITVVFDGGLPGGVSKPLTNSKVQALFASSQRLTADQILLQQIRKAKDPKQFILVSSDREIVSVAEGRKMPCITAHEFIVHLYAKKRPQSEEKSTNPIVSKDEVEAWLKIFSND